MGNSQSTFDEDYGCFRSVSSCSICGGTVSPEFRFCPCCGHEIHGQGINIDCNPYISVDDINKYKKNANSEDRQLLQNASTLVTEESDWVWRNAQIVVVGVVSCNFYAGDRQNKFVIQMNGNGEVSRVCKEKSFRLRVRDIFCSVWEFLKTGPKVLGFLTGGQRPAIAGK